MIKINNKACVVGSLRKTAKKVRYRKDKWKKNNLFDDSQLNDAQRKFSLKN